MLEDGKSRIIYNNIVGKISKLAISFCAIKGKFYSKLLSVKKQYFLKVRVELSGWVKHSAIQLTPLCRIK